MSHWDTEESSSGLAKTLSSVSEKMEEMKATIATQAEEIERLRGDINKLHEKAKLWDGLMNSQRIRILGTAGFDRPEGQYRHFGMEIWSHYGTAEENELRASFIGTNAYGRDILERYAKSTYQATTLQEDSNE